MRLMPTPMTGMSGAAWEGRIVVGLELSRKEAWPGT
jgi:hypothetical protein